jgi:hypothetical protein
LISDMQDMNLDTVGTVSYIISTAQIAQLQLRLATPTASLV